MRINIAEYVRDLARPIMTAVLQLFKEHVADGSNPHKVGFSQTVKTISYAAPNPNDYAEGEWHIQLIRKP